MTVLPSSYADCLQILGVLRACSGLYRHCFLYRKLISGEIKITCDFDKESLEWNIKNTWCVQVLRSPKEAFAAAMQSWRERCEKCVCLQGDYVEK